MQKRQLSNSESWTVLLLFSAILFGGIVRAAPAALSDFPIHDGGMFYVMTGELQANQYLLPETTSYNHVQSPFAYPPLGFYLAGLINDVFRVDLLDLLRWFPAVVSILAIAAFYLLARAMLGSAPQAALASLFFALVPRSISWFLMGGGLTRTLGQLFLLLTVYSVFMCFARRSRRHIWLAILFGGLVCLSHPESIIHTGAPSLLIVLFYGRSRKDVFDALAIIAGVLLVSSPWWGTVLLRDGVAPFRAALEAGGHNPFFWLEILVPSFAEEGAVTVLTVLGLIGLGVELARRRTFLPLWLILPFFIEPRSASAIAIFPLALLASISFSELVLPGLMTFLGGARLSGAWSEQGMKNNLLRVAIGYVVVLMLIGSLRLSLGLANFHLTAEDRTAITWVHNNTPRNGRFLLITGSSQPLGDPLQEWFPALSGRESLSTIQGLEWREDISFATRMQELISLQACANREANCLHSWATRNDLDFEYVLVERYKLSASLRGNVVPEVDGLLLASLRNNTDYQVIYETDSIVIFFRKASPP